MVCFILPQGRKKEKATEWWGLGYGSQTRLKAKVLGGKQCSATGRLGAQVWETCVQTLVPGPQAGKALPQSFHLLVGKPENIKLFLIVL